MSRTIVAVFFGGQTVEHDVSVLTGLQAMDALDAARFEALPVYIDPTGAWYTGAALRARASYPLSAETRDSLAKVGLFAGRPGGAGPALTRVDSRFLGGANLERLPFDIALPAMHGTGGEDGALQGLFQLLHIPFVGSGVLGSAVTMDKAFTKRVLAAFGVPVVPWTVIDRPDSGTFVESAALKAKLDADLPGAGFPLCVKPRSLGSSVGVSRAESVEDLSAALVDVFRMDRAALVETFVPNLAEYNVAVSRAFGEVTTSAIERPLGEAAVLDFGDKYLTEGGKASKVEGAVTEGMASATRVLNPVELTEAQSEAIRRHAATAFTAFDMRGTARVDFLCNSATGEIWLNEINNIPGSLSYYLWEPSGLKLSYTELLTALIDEGLAEAKAARADTSVETARATIFHRRG